MDKGKITKAIFPVGGFGTRFLPATKAIPKEMIPVYNKPLVQYAFEEAAACGITSFIFILGRNKNAIINHFDNSFELEQELENQLKQETLKEVTHFLPHAGQVIFLRQRAPLGLGHAVWCARNLIGEGENFAVLLPDELFFGESSSLPLAQMIKEMGDRNMNVLGATEVAKEQTSKYGIISGDKRGEVVEVTSLVEKPKPEEAPSNFAIVGRYILNKDIFNYLDPLVEARINSADNKKEVQLTDAMNLQCQKEKNYIASHLKATRFDCGTPEGWLEANIYAFGKKK